MIPKNRDLKNNPLFEFRDRREMRGEMRFFENDIKRKQSDWK